MVLNDHLNNNNNEYNRNSVNNNKESSRSFVKDNSMIVENIINYHSPFIKTYFWSELPSGKYLIISRRVKSQSSLQHLNGLRPKKISVVYCNYNRKLFYVFDNRAIGKLYKRIITINRRSKNLSFEDFLLGESSECWCLKEVIDYGNPIITFWNAEEDYFHYKTVINLPVELSSFSYKAIDTIIKNG